LILHQIQAPLPENKLQADLLAQAADAAAALVAKLEVMRGIEAETDVIDSLESSADKVYRRTVAKLFSGDYEAHDLLRWKDIVEGIEAAMNAIEDVANVVETIVLKHA
jgi:uncharacterized protein Yka (UPF0111/DUF47 family)